MNIPEPVLAWIWALENRIPSRVVSNPMEASHLQRLLKENPEVSGTILEALLWVRIGRIDPAHAIVQDEQRGLPAYVHGVIHRIEGDFWNSNYWFRQVRDSELVEWISTRTNASTPTAVLATTFSPSQFVDECQAVLASKIPDPQAVERLQQIAQAEWQALLEYSVKHS